MSIVVDDAHFEYLKIQKGNLDPFASDRRQWHQLYERDLLRTYAEIRPHLPKLCWGLLDIGSGLGGIDVLIGRHYEQRDGCRPYTHLLDGIDDPPVMRLHRETFNSMRVARDFQTKNGLPAERFGFFGTREQFYRRPYDLVVSFGSWCFHYPPSVYLRELTKGGGLHEGTILIVDMRRGKPDWMAEFWDAGFKLIEVVRTSAKLDRIVWSRAGGDMQAAA
jgi:hypothetical protein